MTILQPKLHYGDRALFEGRELAQIARFDPEDGETPVEFRLIFDDPDGTTSFRAVTEGEFRQLIDQEKLVISWSSPMAKTWAEKDLFGRRSVAALSARRCSATIKMRIARQSG